jgi:hypothetical protein
MKKPKVNLPLTIDPLSPNLVYDYQDLLVRGTCLHCKKELQWALSPKSSGSSDDRFCEAICCATKYSMVPEKVRVVTSFAFPMSDDELKSESRSEEANADDDFLRELKKLTLQTGSQVDWEQHYPSL